MKIGSRVGVAALVAVALSLPAVALAAPHGGGAGGFHGGGAGGFHGGGAGAPHAVAPGFRGAPRAVAPGFRGAPRGFEGHRGFHHHGRGGVFVVGPTFWWDPWPPPYYYAPPPVVMQEPAYIQQSPGSTLPQGYWYYCPSAGGYYPNVPTCAEPWVPVTPSGG